MAAEFNIIVVGAGGTGGNFLINLGRFLYSLSAEESYKLTLIDGDSVERKNLTRQPFLEEDIGRNKAEVFAEILNDTFNVKCSFVDKFIDDKEDLHRLADNSKVTLLIGAADNHACRRVMHEFYQEMDTCIYVDSANEFSVGEVAVGVKIGGIEMYPDRTYYFPDILTDQSVPRSQESCQALNEMAPQHLVTNLMAANLLLMIVATILSERKLIGGLFLFDAFKGFCKLQEWEKEEQLS